MGFAARIDLSDGAGDLGLALPAGGISCGRIGRRSVDRNAGISAQVNSLHCAGHRPCPQLTIRKFDLGAADSWRAVTTQRRHGEVLARRHQLPDARRELGLGGFELRPRCHQIWMPA